MNNIGRIGAPPPSPDWVNRMTSNLIKNKDTDNSKTLSVEELGAAEDVFTRIDHNGDGQADRAELNAGYPGLRIDRMTTNLILNKDTNDDKVLSAEELGITDEALAQIDLNGDGQADRAELNAGYPGLRIDRMTTNLINGKDANNDGMLSAEELGVAEDVFSRIDHNGDGQADRVELNAFYPKGQINHMTTKLINDKDTNEDGMLSSEELGISEEAFARIDRNGDGQADRVELNAFYPKVQAYKIMEMFNSDNNDEPSDSINVSA